MESAQQVGHEVGHLPVPPGPVVGAVLAPDVDPDVDVLLGEDVPQGEGRLGDLPGAGADADDGLLPVVLLDVRVIPGHVPQVVH